MRAIEFTMVVWWKLNQKKRREYWDLWSKESQQREDDKMSSMGPYSPDDSRILSCEAQEETYDIKSYLRFLNRKRPDLEEKVNAAKRLAFELFCGLKELETLEREDPK